MILLHRYVETMHVASLHGCKLTLGKVKLPIWAEELFMNASNTKYPKETLTPIAQRLVIFFTKFLQIVVTIFYQCFILFWKIFKFQNTLFRNHSLSSRNRWGLIWCHRNRNWRIWCVQLYFPSTEISWRRYVGNNNRMFRKLIEKVNVNKLKLLTRNIYM